MSRWRNITQYRKSISLLLVAAILLLTIFPSHFHLHPESDSSTYHSHPTVDFHSAELMHHEHSHHAEAVELKVATDNLIKKSKLNSLTFYVLSLILLLLPMVLLHSHRSLIRSTLRPYIPYHHFTPLLRAPPRF